MVPRCGGHGDGLRQSLHGEQTHSGPGPGSLADTHVHTHTYAHTSQAHTYRKRLSDHLSRVILAKPLPFSTLAAKVSGASERMGWAKGEEGHPVFVQAAITKSPELGTETQHLF